MFCNGKVGLVCLPCSCPPRAFPPSPSGSVPKEPPGRPQHLRAHAKPRVWAGEYAGQCFLGPEAPLRGSSLWPGETEVQGHLPPASCLALLLLLHTSRFCWGRSLPPTAPLCPGCSLNPVHTGESYTVRERLLLGAAGPVWWLNK